MLLSFPGLDKLVVPLDEPRAGELISARVWKDTCDTIDLGDEAAKWLQRALNMVRICYNQPLQGNIPHCTGVQP